MGDPRELEWAKKPDALKESWTARIGTHMVHGVSPYRCFGRAPLPFLFILGQVEQRSGVVGEVFYEPTVKVSETEERLYFLLITGFRPVCYTRYFYRIHLYPIFRDDES
jgi:hypothetical protein